MLSLLSKIPNQYTLLLKAGTALVVAVLLGLVYMYIYNRGASSRDLEVASLEKAIGLANAQIEFMKKEANINNSISVEVSNITKNQEKIDNKLSTISKKVSNIPTAQLTTIVQDTGECTPSKDFETAWKELNSASAQ